MRRSLKSSQRSCGQLRLRCPMTTQTLIALLHCAAVVASTRETVAPRSPQQQHVQLSKATASTTNSDSSSLSCQKTCEAAGHCSIGVGSGCDRQPTCSMGCAIAAVPGVTLNQCIAECNAVSGGGSEGCVNVSSDCCCCPHQFATMHFAVSVCTCIMSNTATRETPFVLPILRSPTPNRVATPMIG